MGFVEWAGIRIFVVNYEILTISLKHTLSWVNYDPGSGNILPVGAVIGGYHNRNPRCVVRKGTTYAGHSYGYAAKLYDKISQKGEFPCGTNIFAFQ